MAFLRVVVIDFWPTTEAKVTGLYFRAETIKFSMFKISVWGKDIILGRESIASFFQFFNIKVGNWQSFVYKHQYPFFNKKHCEPIEICKKYINLDTEWLRGVDAKKFVNINCNINFVVY